MEKEVVVESDEEEEEKKEEENTEGTSESSSGQTKTVSFNTKEPDSGSESGGSNETKQIKL